MTDNQLSYEDLMHRCIALGLKAKERGDPPVGSVVAQNGRIISEGTEGGRTHEDITFHAEIEAIRAARKILKTSDLSGCLLVTTHEPCIMCSYVIRHHRIAKVIVALAIGETGGISSHMPVLTDNGFSRWGKPPQIVMGVLAAECELLNV